MLENVSFLAGTNKLNGNGTRYNIERFLIHDNFEETDYGIINDIALLYSACTIFPVKDMVRIIILNENFRTELISFCIYCQRFRLYPIITILLKLGFYVQ